MAGLVVLSCLLSPQVAAGDDPTIQGELREGIQGSMQEFLSTRTEGEVFLLYDPVEDRLLRLSLEKLHEGIVKKGEFYVSCADFVDQHGRKLDVDLLVLGLGDELRTMQAIVHKVEGEKRSYQLEN